MPPRIQMIDLAARHKRLSGKVEAAVLEVLRSGQWIGGERVQAVEQAMAALFHRSHGVGVGSGTDGLILSLRALGLGPGHRVAVPAVSFFASAGAVLATGATPVFVDVLPDRPLMDPARLADTPRVDAVLAVDLFGMLCPLPDLSVPVVRDSAQSAGWDHQASGDALSVSLYPTKTVGGAGDGGVVVTGDATLADRIRALGNHGRIGTHVHGPVVGRAPPGTSRLDALQAAIVEIHLGDLPRRVARRREIATAYEEGLPHLDHPTRHEADAVQRVAVLSPQRDVLRARLDEAGIDSDLCYPLPLDAQPFFSGTADPTPSDSVHENARQYCEQAFCLPCHAEMGDSDVSRVVEVLAQ